MALIMTQHDEIKSRGSYMWLRLLSSVFFFFLQPLSWESAVDNRSCIQSSNIQCSSLFWEILDIPLFIRVYTAGERPVCEANTLELIALTRVERFQKKKMLDQKNCALNKGECDRKTLRRLPLWMSRKPSLLTKVPVIVFSLDPSMHYLVNMSIPRLTIWKTPK